MRLTILILLVLAASSCEKKITIPIPEEANKLVLNLLMNKDSIMVARVTLSGRLTGSGGTRDTLDATVGLYEDGVFRENMTAFRMNGLNYFKSTIKAKPGATYRCTAAVPDYGEVEGSDRVPDSVKTGDMKLAVSPVDQSSGKLTVTVKLEDDPAERNYYRIRLFTLTTYTDNSGEVRTVLTQQYFESEETALGLFSDPIQSEYFTDDALYNGRSPRFTLRATFGILNNDKVMLEVTSLTYHSYNYLHSLYLAQDINEDPLSEKVIVYNNIQNGLGIVGGVAQKRYILH
ncbi:DUF4249 domain-containing protein [Chitinophaga barathri]|uniref:DUF4249 domain-containing protein n=1 Tax=Chitinophaga barathri TaxID=1647451 RepID=A0A3N4M9J7_9BACT|nr:DUF4249 domain-containing protein [Chitinophaga barathri]RPD39995.1 DUF4249 domain-containing protein [Chitinophaga barathri]